MCTCEEAAGATAAGSVIESAGPGRPSADRDGRTGRGPLPGKAEQPLSAPLDESRTVASPPDAPGLDRECAGHVLGIAEPDHEPPPVLVWTA
ncbi:hypothetical protein [Actinophytocola oryzae]|uniref:Uncharacterized protein n=1 Tax=Actinophytocola oryzae TaxID=502181 RepID=A0A4R7UXS6_9PSEU|nr:hypothetical protein [Actinophytocola oryzae]TDV40954.1 hypothetical protein CLV71_12120 [Actinophytocola oryzae]